MKTVVSTDLMRESDAHEIATRTPSLELMRRAGRAILESYPWKGRVAILCGMGNNAGDGYVLATELFRAGIDCRLLLLEEKFSTDGGFYFAECKKLSVPWSVYDGNESFSEDRELVDCLFGTGFHGSVSGNAAMLIQQANASGLPIISADINSGLNGDSGLGEICIRSALTVAIGSYKTGHFLGRAKDVIGALCCADIGIPILPDGQACYLPEAADFAEIFPKRPQLSHKGTFGYIGILGGCTEYAGAAKLANVSCSALRAGCGVATLAVPKTIAPSVSPYLLESTLMPLPDDGEGHMIFDADSLDALMSGRRALAVGMGWGSSKENECILAYLLSRYSGSLVIDADGLNALARMGADCLKNVSCKILLTPHLKEFERISGYKMAEIQNNPVELSRAFAKEYGVCLLLKGACTVVTDGETVYLVNRGCAGMATAGSGDVLSGVLAGLLGYAPMSALTAACGAYIAGRAGELAERDVNPISMLSSDTVAHIAEAIGEMIQ